MQSLHLSSPYQKNVRLNAHFIFMFKFANKQLVKSDIMPNLSAWAGKEE